jgi:Predicted hydrolase of the metallo-beta-lactamase superfamily
MSKGLNLIFLGGVGEIGKNMTALEFGDSIVVIDAGMAFPTAGEMPGIDLIIPDYTYLAQRKDKVKGIVITHGHEDHIGALPYVLKDIKAPVYGSAFAIALAEHKLTENRVTDIRLVPVKEGDSAQIGCFSVEFVQVTHSIAGAFSISVTTPRGVVFFTGDFKIDHTPIDGRTTDLSRIAEIGKKGVLVMLQDSTNVEREGYSMSEMSVGKSLDYIFGQNMHRRIIVAAFASHIHRVQQIINCALKYGRRVALSGRSMENIAKIAFKLKELSFPAGTIIDTDKINSIPYDKLCIITTGTQGEPESALTRMSVDDFKNIVIGENDTVVLSASPIPGNEKLIYTVINNLYKKGAEVVYKDLAEVHVSGHACQEELKLMISLIRPAYFIPVHGEYRHLKQHAELAESLGIPRDNIFVPEIGDAVEVSRGGFRKQERAPAGSMMVDGDILENAELVLRDRKHISEDGFVIAIVNAAKNGELITPPIVITRGFNIPDAQVEEIKESITRILKNGGSQELDSSEIRNLVKKAAAKVISNRQKRRPMIIPITIEN